MDLNDLNHIDQSDPSLHVPPVEPAWADMRRRLEEDDDGLAPIPFGKGPGGQTGRRIIGLGLLLLVAGIALLLRNNTRRNSADRNIISKTSRQFSVAAPKTNGKDSVSVTVGSPSNSRSLSGRKRKKPNNEFSGFNSGEQTPQKNGQEQADSTMNAVNTSIVPAPAKATVPEPAKKSPPADTAKNMAAIEAQSGRHGSVEAGLQWNFQIPLNGADRYFSGPDGNNAVYRSALPAVWVSFRSDENRFSLDFHPFATMVLPDKPYASKFQPVDQLTTITDQLVLRKVFGYSIGFRYEKHVGKNWWLGGGIENYSWRKANLRTDRITEKKNTPTDPSGTITQTSFYGPLQDSSWVYFRKHQFRVNAQAVYEKANWQMGFRAGIFFIDFYNGGNNRIPIQSELFFRLRLFNRPLKANSPERDR
ncbi:MAG: hypothetical protein JO301_12260 [Chitinophagaceae bacterium]|nr:hypothetical protein [Chitinophagaceae bacterium]